MCSVFTQNKYVQLFKFDVISEGRRQSICRIPRKATEPQIRKKKKENENIKQSQMSLAMLWMPNMRKMNFTMTKWDGTKNHNDNDDIDTNANKPRAVDTKKHQSQYTQFSLNLITHSYRLRLAVGTHIFLRSNHSKFTTNECERDHRDYYYYYSCLCAQWTTAYLWSSLNNNISLYRYFQRGERSI